MKSPKERYQEKPDQLRQWTQIMNMDGLQEAFDAALLAYSHRQSHQAGASAEVHAKITGAHELVEVFLNLGVPPPKTPTMKTANLKGNK